MRYLVCRFAQFHCAKFCDNGYSFLAGYLFALLRMDGFQHFGHQLHLGFGYHREQCTVQRWYLASGNTSYLGACHCLFEAGGY